jgi:hypothetical protein
MSTEEKIILFEYEMYSEKEYKPMTYAEFVTKKLIEAKEELSKLHQPTVISAVCDFCSSENLEDCGGGEFTCNDCGHFPITN